tara:strand:+ start:244 stop:444 length:201 start_codon:yes stop_codon:yes gene_type:complete
MQLACHNKIIEQSLYFCYGEGTFELPKTLSEKNYVKPFNVLKDWDLVRTSAINRHKLTSNYFHLLE